MYLGPEMKLQAANAVKNRTHMFTTLASHAMEGQQTEKQNYDTGRKRVNWQPQVLLVCLTATQIVTHTFRKICFFDDVAGCDQSAEDELGIGSDPEPLQDLQQRNGIDNNDDTNSNQNPMKKLVLKAVLDALRIKQKSGVSVCLKMSWSMERHCCLHL